MLTKPGLHKLEFFFKSTFFATTSILRNLLTYTYLFLTVFIIGLFTLFLLSNLNLLIGLFLAPDRTILYFVCKELRRFLGEVSGELQGIRTNLFLVDITVVVFDSTTGVGLMFGTLFPKFFSTFGFTWIFGFVVGSRV